MKKRIAWGLMSGGIGALLLFVMALVIKGTPPSPREWFVYLWPVGGLAMGVFGFVWSRRLYRIDPPEPPAAWTVQLTDLLLGTVFAGACGAIAAREGGDFQKLSALLSLIGLALYVQGSLAASLEGEFRLPQRIVFVVAHVVLTLGYVGVTTLGLCVLIVSVFPNRGPDFSEGARMIQEVLTKPTQDSLMLLFRACVYAFPVGFLVMAALRKWVIARAE